ncbi:WXG100 family type VII secretion target [Streptomyces sp. NRRL F-2890]|uniref:WXG100 family type VII secretion target n=1 Tax=Streptomyces sp. NRRL F-2890 TaxID=1463845 RepID=UPI0004CA6B5E|nr:WXG100 family type VII secretion target [Streptomyces sp. NRRL F-2890]
MMDDRISVSYAGLESGSQQMGSIEGELQKALEDIQGAMLRVSAGWTGEAKTALDQNMMVFDAELEKLQGVTAATGRALGTVGANYHRTDQRGANLIAPI